MKYEITKTMISTDRKECFYIYKHNISIDDVDSDTYGLSVSGISECFSVDDVTTDEEVAIKLLDEVSKHSVSKDSLNDFVLDFLSIN